MISKYIIDDYAERYYNDIVNIRRHLHKHPELSFNEKETSEFIVRELKSIGLNCKTGIAGYGIIADIKGKNPEKGKMIALRADIDALPIQEMNNVDYASVNKKVMHACGHDAHTACLIGAAKILCQLKEKWNGVVRLIFQPAEEKLPGGAKKMLDEGIFLDREPDFVIAQHVDPELRTGYIGIKQGMYMASTDEIYITLTGKGGHAAMPDKISDTVLAAAQIVVSLQQIVSRNLPPGLPAVLSIGKIIADGATNIIPEKVNIEGTFRTFNEKQREFAHARITEIVQNTANIYNTKADIEIRKGYPFLINNEQLSNNIRKNIIEYAGKDKLVDLDLRMTSEDFSYFSQKYPSVLYRLGTCNPDKNSNNPLHSEYFNIDEDALLTGAGFLVYNTLKLLE
ncbi:MAG: M20 family metallopeptidase [Marinilabiliales bacterium]